MPKGLLPQETCLFQSAAAETTSKRSGVCRFLQKSQSLRNLGMCSTSKDSLDSASEHCKNEYSTVPASIGSRRALLLMSASKPTSRNRDLSHFKNDSRNSFQTETSDDNGPPSLCSSQASLSSNGAQEGNSLSSSSHHRSPFDKQKEKSRAAEGRDTSRRQFTLPRWPSSNSLNGVPNSKKAQGSGHKRVRFASDFDRSTVPPPSPMSYEEYKNLFWTTDEIASMSEEAYKLVREFVKRDEKVVNCLTLLRESCNQPKAEGASQLFQSGFTFLYSNDIKVNDHGELTKSTCRGLESIMMADLITDARMDCVHAVLRRQNNLLQQKESPSKKKSDKQKNKKQPPIEVILAKESAKFSASARTFARLLGKVDEAMLKGKSGSSRNRRSSIQ